jgi:hypothetical protein
VAPSRHDASRDRLALSQLIVEFHAIVDAFCAPEPLFPGKVVNLRRTCGKVRCRCASGQLHESIVLMDRSAGKPKLRTLEPKELRALRKLTRTYRELRRLRARLPGLLREALRLCDRLRDHRLRAGLRMANPPKQKRAR